MTEYYLVFGIASYDEDRLGEIQEFIIINEITKELLDENGLVLLKYGYDINRHLWIIGIKDSLTVGQPGNIDIFEKNRFEPDSEWFNTMRRFCRETKLPFREPKWILSANGDI